MMTEGVKSGAVVRGSGVKLLLHMVEVLNQPTDYG
jgi:hypothetical protein